MLVVHRSNGRRDFYRLGDGRVGTQVEGGGCPTSVSFLAEIFNSPPCFNAKYEKVVCGWIWRWKGENGGGEWKWMK
jgi:hypothetical protein